MPIKNEEIGQWKKGQSGNPKGKPKGCEHSSTRLKRLFTLMQSKKNPFTGEEEGFSVLEQMDMAQVIKALKGDTRAYKELIDRLEGMARQNVHNTGNGPVTIKIVEKD